MSKRLTSEQKKKRLHQLRDAQRRRRAKLKVESQRFVQIIIPAGLLEQLREISGRTGETVQQLIGRIVAEAVPQMGGHPVPAETSDPVAEMALPELDGAEYPEPAKEVEAPVAVEIVETFVEPQPVAPAPNPWPENEPVEVFEAEEESFDEVVPPPQKIPEREPVAVAAKAGQLDLFG